MQGQDSKWGACAFQKEMTCDMVNPTVVATGELLLLVLKYTTIELYFAMLVLQILTFCRDMYRKN